MRKGVVADLVADYGHVIVDECHHLSAHSFEQAVRQAKARFVLGLSATVARKDGHHPIIFMQCGPVRHQVNARAQAASRPFEHFVLVQPTAFQPTRNPDPDKRVEFQTLYQELIDDQARTRRICEDVIDSVRNGRSPLILTEHNDHLDRFEKELATRVDHVVVLRAGTGKKQRQAVKERLAAIRRQEGRVILATGKYVGEGFGELRDLREQKLVRTIPIRDGRALVVLTERGRDVRERNRHEREQRFYSGLQRPRELLHDAKVYQAYEREAERLRGDGAIIRRVMLDTELKRERRPPLVLRNSASRRQPGRCVRR